MKKFLANVMIVNDTGEQKTSILHEEHVVSPLANDSTVVSWI